MHFSHPSSTLMTNSADKVGSSPVATTRPDCHEVIAITTFVGVIGAGFESHHYLLNAITTF